MEHNLGVMERNRDLRRTSVSTVNGLPRRRERITTRRDSTDQDRQPDFQEPVRSGDREQLQKKDRERELAKRRRIEKSTLQQRSDGTESYRENDSTDSSDEEYYEEEEETRIHQHSRTNQVSPTCSSLSNNRRGLRTLRSSPVLRAATDEMFDFPIPRRARSASAKRLHEYCYSGSGRFGDDFSHWRSFPSPMTVSPIGSHGASPSSSGASMKIKMKSVDRKTPDFSGTSNPNTSVQDDIEIEVAEALFDLMKQSQSQSRPLRRQENVDRDGMNTDSDESKMSKADDGKDEPSIKVTAETILADSVKELKREGRVKREKFPDNPAQDLVNGEGFFNKEKVGSPKENESPSCVIKVNACDIQDPTVVTKALDEAIIAEVKKEIKVEIDLMALPPVAASAERDALVDVETDTEVTTQVVQKNSEMISKDGSLTITQQQQGRKEQKNQSSASVFPLSIGTSSWSGVLPHPGCTPPLEEVLPINGSARSSMIVQPPQFKYSQPREKRCATHQFLARNIQSHQELMKKSLSSGSIGPGALCETKLTNFKYMLPSAQNFIPGNPLLGDFQGGQSLASATVGSVKDRHCDAAISSNANATINEKSVLQQASHLPSASNLLRGHGFIFPFGHNQTAMMAPGAGSPQSASPVGNTSLPPIRLSVNLPLPSASSAVSLNHQLFPSNEAYMAMLQNNGCPIPISTNIAIPSFKGGSPSMPFFNPSLYSSPMFNVSQNHQQLTIPHVPAQSSPQTTNSLSHKQHQSQKQTSDNFSDIKFPSSVTTNSQQSVANGSVSHSVKHSNSQPTNFAMISHVSVGGGVGISNKTIDPPQQGSKGGGSVELVPQAFALSFSSNASTSPALNFSSMTQNSGMFHLLPDMAWNGNHLKNFQVSEGKSVSSKEISALSTMCPPKFDRSVNFLPSSLTGNQQQLIQVQNSQMHQLQLVGSTTQIKPYPFGQISNRNDNSSIPQRKSSQGQSHINFGNTPTSTSTSTGVGTGGLTMSSAVPSQEAPVEPPPGGTGQKSSSPACRRIVPSILRCHSQLPELKY